MFEMINRGERKRETAELLRTVQVPAKLMTALYLALLLLLNLIDSFAGIGFLGTFISIMTGLLASVLGAGFVLYCMAIRRGERAEYLTLFDGFSFVGKIICLEIVEFFFICLWSLLFIIPGFIAGYRYSFALYNLCENPGIGVMEALDMSKRQTLGYKSQLFTLDLSYLGWSLLSALPAYIMSLVVYYRVLQNVGLSVQDVLMSPGVLSPVTYLGFPVWAWVLIQSLWTLAVSLFYLPNFYCVQLSYFETAKTTSGVGLGAQPRNGGGFGGGDGGWQDMGPDGLGPF